MSQLSGKLSEGTGTDLTLEQAIALIGERMPVVADVETVPLALADGRVCAQDVVALGNLPRFDNAAVDGFAVRFANLAEASETVLPLTGRIAAGASAVEAVGEGVAFRIFTGAPMPAGADTVAMQEHVGREGDAVRLPAGLREGANCRRAGEDVARGSLILRAGKRLTPQDLALAAASGHDRLTVRKPLRVALFSTGDELREAGEDLPPGAIIDSNRIMLAALLRRLGVAVGDLGILRDEPAALARRVQGAAAEHDLVLTSGGVSEGEADHVRAVVDTIGQLVFWRLAVKPGRPVAMGLIGETPFVGVPGNPVAAFVNLLFVVRPLLDRLGGAAHRPVVPLPVRAGFRLARRAGRREFLRVRLVPGADGTPELQLFARDGAAMLSPLAQSDGLAEIPEAVGEITPGDPLGFYPHALLWSA